MKNIVITERCPYHSAEHLFDTSVRNFLKNLGDNIIIHSINYTMELDEFKHQDMEFNNAADNRCIVHSALILYDDVPTRKIITEKKD